MSTPPPRPDRRPVVVVGAGPTGVLAALLLARRGVEVVVLERHPDVYPLPRAVHVDDEVARLLQGAGIGPAFAAVRRASGGLRLLDARHRTIAEFRRPPAGRHGHPQASTFDQPALERLLRTALAAQPTAAVRTGAEVLAVEPGPVVLLEVDGRQERLAAAAVLGCDGAHSVVREAVGARWQDLRFEEDWLVVDARCDVALQVWDGVDQVCDGRRAATFLQVGPDRYRWEFQLSAGETAEQLRERLPELVRPWLRPTPSAHLVVLRSAGYTFRARLADRWRRDRVFLLGDAAHLTPPFIGQGLGSGLRDAANLSWKLAAVLQGRAPEDLLATYQAERRPHARTLVRLAVLAGRAMTGGGGRTAALRRVALGAAFRAGLLSDRALRAGTPALVPGPLVLRGHRLAGTLAPQPCVRVDGAEVPLDAVLGDGFAVVTAAAVDPALAGLARRLDAVVLRVAPDGVLGGWLRRAGVRTAVLRPDRAVLLTARSSSAPGLELERVGAEVLRLVGAPTDLPAPV